MVLTKIQFQIMSRGIHSRGAWDAQAPMPPLPLGSPTCVVTRVSSHGRCFKETCATTPVKLDKLGVASASNEHVTGRSDGRSLKHSRDKTRKPPGRQKLIKNAMKRLRDSSFGAMARGLALLLPFGLAAVAPWLRAPRSLEEARGFRPLGGGCHDGVASGKLSRRPPPRP